MYKKVSTGHYRKCQHKGPDDSDICIKVWEKKSHSIKLCPKCGNFWHKLLLIGGTDYTLAAISDILTYRHEVFDYKRQDE